ncbi:MAG: citrate synthase [halophilic archaeon J07HB67]|jgi:citrate synthase (EC 2.3.3.1)|nr:MAG: citrate synthase [halophilic archaeon J07HB67]
MGLGNERTMSEELQRGLEGVLVAESTLSYIDGGAGQLVYRGYDIEDLAEHASYEETLYLLWNGELPTASELSSFRDAMAAERSLPEEVSQAVRTLGRQDGDPMAALQTTVSMLSAYDEDRDAEPTDTAANVARGRRITAKLPTALATFARARDGEEPVAPDEELDHAANFLYMLNGEQPDAVAADVFDQALVLHADHGLNASTFGGLVTASTLADLHASVTGAIGALSGSLHGGANADVMRMLEEIDAADQDPVEWVEQALEDGRRVAGFGHRVYDVKDPRARILGERSEELGRPPATPGGTRCRRLSSRTWPTRRGSRRTSTSTRPRRTTRWESRSTSTRRSSRSRGSAGGSHTSSNSTRTTASSGRVLGTSARRTASGCPSHSGRRPPRSAFTLPSPTTARR